MYKSNKLNSLEILPFPSVNGCIHIKSNIILAQSYAQQGSPLATDLIKELDKEDIEINHSVSYGYAYRHETEEKDTHTVFMLADQRMYNYKREHYAHMMGR